MLRSSDITWQTPAEEQPLGRRAWRRLDRVVEAELRSIDRDLSAWAGWSPKTEAVDQLLDERLYRRPRDVMDTWPARRDRHVETTENYWENP